MQSAFTYKGILVGALLSLCCGAGAVYGMLLVRGSWWGLNASAPGAILLFFILTCFVNTVLAFIRRPLALGPGDLVLVYAMMLMALTLPTQNFLVHIIPTICVPFYSASPENDWRSTLHPYIPDWIAPQNYEAIKNLYEGLPKGQSIPWDAWYIPLGAWCALFVALSLMMICLAVILHRQWSQAEHLAYPMAQLPQAMLDPGSDPQARLAPFFKNPLVWIGFALPLVFFSFGGLNHYFPSVPAFNQFLPNWWWFQDEVRVIVFFSFAWIGFFYLVSLEIIFSIWFFYLFTKLEEGAFSLLGIASTEKLSRYEAFQSADLVHQGVGAFIVFAVFGLWMARRHLRAVVRKAWNPTDPLDDSQEILSYRACLVGLVASLLFVSSWLWLSGVPLVIIPVFLAIVLIYYIVITRVVAAGGIPTTRPPIVPPFFIISGLGASILGDRGLVAMGFAMGWAAEMRLFPMIACANSLKLAEKLPGPKRRLFWGMILAILCGLAGSIYVLMELAYTHGGINLIRHFINDGAQWNRLAPLIDRPPSGPDMRGWVFTGIGGLIEGFLMWANHRFFWWPLHPLGFVIAAGFITGQIWFSAFIAWLLKAVILQYGGPGFFAKLKPFFLGMILGEATVGGLWLLVDALTGHYGNRITAM